MSEDHLSSRCAVIGNPIAHSRSPQIHQWFAHQFELRIDYQRIQAEDNSCEKASFEKTVTQFFSAGGRGLNITSPFKQQAFAMADIQSPAACQAESGNTLWLENGQLHVTSTDGAGWYQHIQHLGVELKDCNILILGAGGAGRVIFEYLKELGTVASIVLANRSQEKLATMHFPNNTFGVTLDSIPNQDYDLIINALPTGWQNSFPEVSVPVTETTAAYDLNYAEGAKSFQEWFLAAGGQQKNFYDGWGMLVCQAALSFEIWWAQKPQTAELINHPELILSR
ncbi:MAG: shikimate dehydrogenase [Enterobacterales bacterium]|nr:shikimate dehydrogenase [Enterobacterales bacterium]